MRTVLVCVRTPVAAQAVVTCAARLGVGAAVRTAVSVTEALTRLAEQSADLKEISPVATYGWGVIPVHVRINKTKWETSLFPKDGLYLVPIKASVRKAENLEEGDEVTIRLEVRL